VIPFLERHATSRRALSMLILLLATMVLVNRADLPFTGPWLSRISGGGEFLDVHFFYTSDDAQTVIADYGPAGRHACLAFYCSWDVAIPVLAMTFTALGLATTWGLGGRRRWLLLVPALALAFDFLENLLLSVLLIRYPDGPRCLAGGAGVITLLKWVTYGTSAGVVLAGSLGRLWTWIKPKLWL